MFRGKDIHRFGRHRLGRRRFLALTAGALGCGALQPQPNLIESAAAQDIVPVQGTTPASDVADIPSDPGTTPGAGTLYFAETGHNLAEPFRSRWQQAGG